MSKKIKITLSILGAILIILILVLICINNKKISTQIENPKEKIQLSEQLQNTTLSTSSYTPENIDRSNNNNNNNSSFNPEDLEKRSLENVKVEIFEESISNSGLTVVITDNNEIPYTWQLGFYKLEQKIDDNWQELLPNKPLEDELIGYRRDENNQFKFKINWTKYYGTLENGIYRIVEIPHPLPEEKEYIHAYSNEFEINE